MRKRRCARRRRRLDRRPDELASPGAATGAPERLGPQYAAGPALRLDAPGRGSAPAATPTARAATSLDPRIAPLPAVRAAGPTRRETAQGGSLRLAGRTDADFSSSFSTEGVTVARASGCRGCAAGDCVRATGTLVATYSVATTVTLPRVDQFPNLTACQRRRVQDAIDNVLAPHEQEHVRAFHTYDGTTSRPFDMTICRGDFDARIRSMFDAEDRQRRAAARAASAALDPFHFDVDLDCQDAPRRQSAGLEAVGPPEDE